MTCGIAIPVDGKVVLASGSRILAGTHKMPDSKKILKIGAFTAVSAGMLKAERLSLIQFYAISSPAPISFPQLIETWANSLVELNIPSEDGIEFLVAVGDCLWFVDSDGVVMEHSEGFLTIGSGGDMARGFLGASKKPKTVEEAEKLALRCLKYVSLHMVCEGPPFATEVT